MYRVKLLVIGPCQGGKTVISNLLAEATESSSNEYHPTQGVRILEFESERLNVQGRLAKAEIELWDCSGDQKFEPCWPALMRDTHGVIMVYSPSNQNAVKEMDTWYSHFVQAQGLRDSQCLVICCQQSGTLKAPQLSSLFTHVQAIHINMEETAEIIHEEFSAFLQRLLSSLSEKREQEELGIMNQYPR